MTEEKDPSRFSSQYERGLLGLIYANKDLLLETKQRISSEVFLYRPHRIIYTAMCLLSDHTELSDIDVDTLYIESSKLGLDSSGVGTDYLMVVCQSDYSRSNYELYVTKVQEAFNKYKLNETLNDLQSLVDKNYSDVIGSKSAKELYDLVSTEISRLEAFGDTEKEAVLVNERAEDFLKERADDPTTVKGQTTGYPRLDEDLNGLTDGSLTVIAGMPGAGKSTLLLNVANHVALDSENPKPVLFLSTEMYTDEDISRLIAMRSCIRERNISNGTAYHDPKQREVLNRVVQEIKNGQPIFHEYMPDFNASKIASKMNYYKHKYDIGLVVFDYIKLETNLDFNHIANRREDQILGDITNILKLTAGKLGIAALAGCQINSRSMRVADSDRIIRYCNNLIELRPKTVEQMEKEGDVNKYGTHEFIILKARAGGGKKHPVRFWKPCNLIQEADLYYEEESDEGDSKKSDWSNLLTTPREFERKINDSFRVSRVETVSQQVTPSEMELQDSSFEPPLPYEDDDMF